MNLSTVKQWAFLPLVGVLLAGPAYAESGESDPHAHHRAMAKSSSSAQRSTAQYEIPDLAMIDQHGETISTSELFATDRPVMVNFIFTTCTAICPMMTSIFQQVQTRLGDEAEDILMVSVSIDPEQDSPDALAEYAEAFRAGPQWSFLTGSLEDSIALQQAFQAYRGDKMKHAPLTLMRADPSSDWVRFNGFASAAELEDACRSFL